jgi:hypothetical protein
MNTIVLERRLSHKQAQTRLSHWIRMQKMWDSLIKRKTGEIVYPPPHEVYRVTKDGRKYAVVFDDPTF